MPGRVELVRDLSKIITEVGGMTLRGRTTRYGQKPVQTPEFPKLIRVPDLAKSRRVSFV